MSDRAVALRKDVLLCLVLVLVTLAVFWQVSGFDFVNYDDDLYVYDNPHVTAGLTLAGLKWALTANVAANWHPLTVYSHMLDCQVFGLWAGGHHLTSLALHVANALLLFALLRWMTGARWRSFFVAGLFALHPLHVQSVAWISERKDVLSTFLGLLAALGYVSYAKRSSKGWYAVSLLCLALGLMAKPMLVTLPFLFLLFDYWPLGRLAMREAGQRVRPHLVLAEKVPFLALAGISVALTFVYQRAGGAVDVIEQFSLPVRLANACVSYAAYALKMCWPAKLAVFYPHPESGLVPWHVALSALSLVGVSVVVVLLRRSRSYLIVGWLWYVGMLVPVIGLVQVGQQAMADRYTYVPLIGLFIMVTWGVADLLGKRANGRRIGAALGMLALLACAGRTWVEVGYWRNSETLFSRALAVTRDNVVAHTNLGEALARQERYEEAIGHFEEVLRIEPEDTDMYYNLGLAMSSLGRYEEAVEHFNAFIAENPGHVGARLKIGRALIELERFDEAVAHFEEALRVAPSSVDAHFYLALVSIKQEKFEDAISHLRTVLRYQPNHPTAAQVLEQVQQRQTSEDRSGGLQEQTAAGR